jgi:hypothetical protein
MASRPVVTLLFKKLASGFAIYSLEAWNLVIIHFLQEEYSEEANSSVKF